MELTTEEAETTTYIVGAPKLTFTYSGTGSSSHVYAQLVDNTTGLVLGNQVTPIAVTLAGARHEAVVDLEPVAHTLAPAECVDDQADAANRRCGGDQSAGRRGHGCRLGKRTRDSA